MPDTRLAVGALALLCVAMFAGWMALEADGDPSVPRKGSFASRLCADVSSDGAVLRLWKKRPNGACHSEDMK